MDCDENQIEKKNKTNKNEANEDRISNLPDSLLADQIISRLPDIRFAIRTGTLSKRWQNLWHAVSSLTFDDSLFKSPIPPEDDKVLPVFYISVHKTLTKLEVINIKKFEINANYSVEFEAFVENFIDFAIDRNVKQFKLYLKFVEDENQFTLGSQSFFTNSHFTHLDLGYCEINPTVAISWGNLTQLTIAQVLVNEDLIENILSGSPSLHTLILDYCYGSLINITSKSVAKMVLNGYNGQEDEYILEINAPYISSLTITGDLNLENLLLKDVSSLVIAKLDYVLLGYIGTTDNEYEEDMLKRLLIKLKHVKELQIGVRCYEGIIRFLDTAFILPSILKAVDLTYESDNEDSDNVDL